MNGGTELISLQTRERPEPKKKCLRTAIKNGSEQEMKTLLSAIDNADEINDHDDLGFNALHYAVKFNRLLIMNTLSSKGADLDCQTLCHPYLAPLHLAAQHNAVEMIDFLIKKGANKEVEDEDCNTPLLTAVAHGQQEALSMLISLGCATSVRGSNGRSAVFIAAEKDQSEVLEYLLTNSSFSQFRDTADTSGNTPLHAACANGNIACVKVLIDNGVEKLNCSNEDQRTPMHLAAENGHSHVVKELLKRAHQSNFDLIEDLDKRSNTALHFACRLGHYNVAKVLLKAKANPNMKTECHLTPLHLAASGGHKKIVELLIKHEADVDGKDSKQWTPLFQACASGHAGVADILIHNNASLSEKTCDGDNALDIAIEHENEDVAMVIAKCNRIEDALRNTTRDEDRDCETTPLRKLIIKMPDVAKEVFKYCLEKVKENGVEVEKFKYEFLDDFNVPADNVPADLGWCPPKRDSSNHCLALLIRFKRHELLKHPLVTNLLDYKWWRYGFWINLLLLFFYVLFVFFLTTFALTALPPRTQTCVEVWSGNHSAGICENDASNARLVFVAFSGAVIVLLASIKLLFELFQLYSLQHKYFLEWVNYVEVPLYLFSIMFAFVFTTKCFCPYPWQWQIGALCLFLSWIELVILIGNFPRIGIYVLMFRNISFIFVKVAFLAALLIPSFAISFYMLFYDPEDIAMGIRTPFHDPWRAIVKTMTMTTGEFEFDRIFRQDGTENQPNLQYAAVSYILWILFLILMPILLTNLLVGLAVSDVSSIQEDAELRNLNLEIQSILFIEDLLPRSVQLKWNKPQRTTVHKKYYFSWRKIKIRRSLYDEFEKVYKLDAEQKTDSEKLSEKVDKIESKLEQQMKMMNEQIQLIESIKATLEKKERSEQPSIATRSL